MGKFWRDKTRGWVRKKLSGMLEHKSGNISETRRDRGKLLYEEPMETHQRSFSDGTIPTPLSPDWRFAAPPKLQPKIAEKMSAHRGILCTEGLYDFFWNR